MSHAVTSAKMLGAELRNWRKSHALTQTEVAGRLGLAQKAISALENHPERSSIDRLMQVLSVLDLELVVRPRCEPASLAQDW
jgi:HTH-type transcriptional regulator / antitoxin HipB